MAMDDQPIFNTSPEKQLMIVMATSTSFSAEREPSLRAGQPAPSNLPAQDINAIRTPEGDSKTHL